MYLCSPFPWKQVVGAPPREAVVSYAYDALVFIDYTSSDLRGRVFAAHGREEGNGHEVVVPNDAVIPLLDLLPLLLLLLLLTTVD